MGALTISNPRHYDSRMAPEIFVLSGPNGAGKSTTARVLRNFFKLYRPLADAWTLCDNSGVELVTVARGKASGATTVLDAQLLATIESRAINENA